MDFNFILAIFKVMGNPVSYNSTWGSLGVYNNPKLGSSMVNWDSLSSWVSHDRQGVMCTPECGGRCCMCLWWNSVWDCVSAAACSAAQRWSHCVSGTHRPTCLVNAGALSELASHWLQSAGYHAGLISSGIHSEWGILQATTHTQLILCDLWNTWKCKIVNLTTLSSLMAL